MSGMVKLTFLGDMLCQREQIAAERRLNCGYDVIFDGVKHLWADSDYVIGNLETPVAGKKLKYAYEAMRFNAPDEFLQAIKRAGVDFLSTANNHALDRGVIGLNNTIHKLDELGFDHDGTYLAEKESDRVFIKDFDGVRIAFVSCTYGTNQGLKCNHLDDGELWRVSILKYPEQLVTTRAFLLRRFVSNLIPLWIKSLLRRKSTSSTKNVCVPDSVPSSEIGRSVHEPYRCRIVEKIRRAKSLADVVIVLPHIGGQYCMEPGEYQLYTMQWMAEAGADLIVANHAHTPQKSIRFKTGALGFCALGDFCFSANNNGRERLSDYSVILHISVDKNAGKIGLVGYDVAKTVLDESGISVCKTCGNGREMVGKLLGAI